MKPSFHRVHFTAEAVAADPGGGGAAPAAAAPVAAAPSAFLGNQPAASAGGDSPAPSAPTNFFGDHVQEGGNFKEGWTSAIAEKHPALANQLMRYKTEGDAFTGLENLVKTVGKKTAGVSYPKAGASEAEIAAFRTDAGVPGRAEEYNLKPENLPEGIGWDDATGKTFSELMHKHHIPAAAAKELVAAHLQNVAAQGQGAQQATQAKLGELVAQTTAEFQREWGVEFQNRVDANNDFVAARLPAEALADPALQMALSHPSIVRIIDEARRASREAPLPGGANTVATGSMSPRQQAMEIIKGNPKWRKDPETEKRVNDLYAQEAQAQKRKAGR